MQGTSRFIASCLVMSKGEVGEFSEVNIKAIEARMLPAGNSQLQNSGLATDNIQNHLNKKLSDVELKSLNLILW